MKTQFTLPLTALLCAAALILARPAAAQTIPAVSSWTAEYKGIDFATESSTTSGTSQQLEQGYAFRIDLTAPGISFETTPSSAPSYPGYETYSQTTGSFLSSIGAQVAINANFFSTVQSTPTAENLSGLAVSDGQQVSAADVNFPSLLLSAANQATITPTSPSTDLSSVFNAVSGSAIILQNGAPVDPGASVGGDPEGLDPRTDVGLSQDGRYLYLLVIDGRNSNYSVGVTQEEAGQWLLSLGAYTGLNLDGGGSSTIVKSNGTGGATVINQPSGGTQRYDGNNLAVFAQPLASASPSPSPSPTPNPSPAPAATPYSGQVLANSPVAYFKLAETSGTTAIDSSGNGHNGVIPASGVTLGNASTPLTSETGSTIYAAGSSGDHVTIPYSAALNPGSFTVEAWADPTNASATFQAVVSSRHDKGGGSAGNSGFILYDGPATGSSGNVWQFWTGGNTSLTYNYEGRNQSGEGLGPAVTLNKWSFIVGTFLATSGPDGTGRYTGTQDLYVNGQLVLTLSGVKYLPNPDEPLYIGAGGNELNPSDSFDFTGGLAQVAIYNTALSSTQITQQYQAASVPEATSLWLAASAGPVLAFLLRRRRKALPA